MHFSNDWSDRLSKHLDDLLRWILLVRNEHMMTFTSLSAAYDKILWAPVSDADSVNSCVFIVISDHPDDSSSVEYSAISQQINLSKKLLYRFVFKYFL